jgi:DNA-binding transcriptional LysR family regulator
MATPLQLDVSIDVRPGREFDMAIRTGHGDWPDFEVTQLMPVDVTPMLGPQLAASVRLESPRDLTKLPLLQHDDWPLWFPPRRSAIRRTCATALPRIRPTSSMQWLLPREQVVAFAFAHCSSPPWCAKAN